MKQDFIRNIFRYIFASGKWFIFNCSFFLYECAYEHLFIYEYWFEISKSSIGLNVYDNKDLFIIIVLLVYLPVTKYHRRCENRLLAYDDVWKLHCIVLYYCEFCVQVCVYVFVCGISISYCRYIQVLTDKYHCRCVKVIINIQLLVHLQPRIT